MFMEEKEIQIEARLEHSLEQASQETDPIVRCTKALNLIETSIKDFLADARSNLFRTTADEVRFFKVSAPSFYSKYLYYRNIQGLEILRRNSTTDNMKMVIKKEFEEIDTFANSNDEFLSIYYRGSTDQDETTFTRQRSADNWILNDYSPIMARNFSPATTKVATLLANEKIRCYVERMQRDLENPGSEQKIGGLQDYTWQGAPKAAAWELLNKLAERRIIYYKGEPADKKRVAEFARLALNLQLGNIYEIDRKNRVRKKDQYPFIRSLLDDTASADQTSATG